MSVVVPNFHSIVRNQFRVKIKNFRIDNVGDYFNEILSPYFQSQGIIHDSSCVNTPQQNRVAERKMGIYSIPLELYYFKKMFLNPIGVRRL